MQTTVDQKKDVKDFWNTASCGEDLYLKGFTKEDYKNHSQKRYKKDGSLTNFVEGFKRRTM
ncbi:MAG: hypothetical protein RLZZ628_4158 [Bacteroidota bacterium]|jgi:hypothetical protein